ncbi:MAG TPA: mycofactocin system FadH/OYE family oxidoreductase 1 [Acidimicrobiales bacterium]|nr:mycofactocin system FadH/OYE family oxidoreductase 1 [Acidimicrobiales bacterium]
MSILTEPVRIGNYQAPSRVVFGPHETNLAWGRSMGNRHLAYYLERAASTAGVIVTETASVTDNDWPYERAPLARLCIAFWATLVEACEPHGTLVLAGLGHAGGEGSSAYSQEVMWAPSRVADVVTREPPAELDQDGIDEIVRSFAAAASGAVGAGVAGVELDSGAWSLMRQFQSGLTNQRSDAYGEDKLLFTRQVLEAVRQAIGPDRLIGLRISGDELAPWAGITPELAAAAVKAFAPMVDLVTVVRAGPYASEAYRPDLHTAPMVNADLCASMREAAGGEVPVVLQGSVVDVAAAEAAIAGGVADLVEMTRAQIAEPRLVEHVRAGTIERARPCLLCNQMCRVRDNRNPIVTCVGEPRSGHETEDAPATQRLAEGAPVLVVGGGPAGMECARVLAGAGRKVRIAERNTELGGVLSSSAVGAGRDRLRLITDWLAAECARLAVEISLGEEVTAGSLSAARSDGWQVVLATGSRLFPGRFPTAAGVTVLDSLTALRSVPAELPPGPIVVDDPVGDWVGVSVAESLAGAGRQVSIVSPDPVAGTLLARTGDLSPANVRLQRAGVKRQLRSRIKSVGSGELWVEDVWTGEKTAIPVSVLVDCGHRLPDDGLYRELDDPSVPRAGDCVAPRTVHEAILEGRRAAMNILGGAS